MKLRVSPSDRRIHYPGLLVILERRLRSRETALDALEEYKTRGSWVPRTTLFLSFFPHPSLPLSSLRVQPFLRFTIPRLYPTSFARSIFFPLFSPPLSPSPRYLLTPVPHDGSESFWGFRYIHAGKSIKEGSMYLKRSSDRTVSDCFEAGCMDGYKMTRPFSYALRNWRYVARFRERTVCIGMSY